jgi:type IV secretion system protein TrbL
MRRRFLIWSGTACVAVGLIALAFPASAPAGPLHCITHPIGCVTGAVGGVVGGLASDAITALAQAVMKWVVSLVETLATVWVGITPPALTDSSGQATGTVAWLSAHLAPLTAALAMMSVFAGAFKIAVEERPSAHLRELAKYFFTFVLVSASAAAFVGTAIVASDDLATWMIHNAIGNETFSHKIGTLLGVTLQGAPPVGFAATVSVAIATIVLGLLACLAMVVQVMIMLLRGAMLIALAGTLPAAAAASNTEVGMQWFKKQVAWVLAWAAYPLAAAVIYSAAFLLPGQGGLDALLSGVLLLIASVVALPVLIRFLVPMTAAVSGGGGAGQMALEGAAAAMLMRGLPTGAAEVNEDSAHSQSTGGDGEGSGGPDGAAPAGGDDGSTGAGDGGGEGVGAAAGEGAGAGAGGEVAAGVGVVRPGMNVADRVGETAVDGVEDGSGGFGGDGGAVSAGANGSGSATRTSGGYADDGPVGDGSDVGAGGGAGGSNGSATESVFAGEVDGGPSGGGVTPGGPVDGGEGPSGSGGAGLPDGGVGGEGDGGGMSEGPSGSDGAAGPSGA